MFERKSFFAILMVALVVTSGAGIGIICNVSDESEAEESSTTHTEVRLIGGETWTYTPATNWWSSEISISGTATSWVTLTEGTVSGTAPTNTSVGQTYDLTITASTTQPSQNATQTITFTVDPQITMGAPATYSVDYGTDVDDILGSNFTGGGRSIFSITGGTATGFAVDAVNGIVEWVNPTPGTVVFTATSPYIYTSGATNTATATMDVTVTGILSASVSGTLYLVKGKTVPNTPAEAVTFNHNDVGEGTYTWAITGMNLSGVIMAPDGTLSGTPRAIGNYALTVQCTSNVSGTIQTANTTLNIVIVDVLKFTTYPDGGTIVTAPVEGNSYVCFTRQGSYKYLYSADSEGNLTSDKGGADVTWNLSTVGNVYTAIYTDADCTTLLENISPHKIGEGQTGSANVHVYASVTVYNSPIVPGQTYYVRVEAYDGDYGSNLIAVGIPYAITGHY